MSNRIEATMIGSNGSKTLLMNEIEDLLKKSDKAYTVRASATLKVEYTEHNNLKEALRHADENKGELVVYHGEEVEFKRFGKELWYYDGECKKIDI